eukprot:jgi/Bigna1/142041/aug1.67_g16749
MEINLLVKLRKQQHVIQLIDAEEKKSENKIFMIFEIGSTDLSALMRRRSLSESLIRAYWEEILKCVKIVHEQRIVHLDLKPQNFVLVDGIVKIIDFGIARQIRDDVTSVVRDSQVGTLNYMSPESISNASTIKGGEDDGKFFRLRRSSDIWSLGCILYQMAFGRAPFAHIKNIMQKMFAICDPKHAIKIPSHPDKKLMDCIKM